MMRSASPRARSRARAKACPSSPRPRSRQAAFLRGRLVIAAHDRDAAIERLLRGLDDRDGDAGAEEIHGDAAAHGPGADHADARDPSGRLVGTDAFDLRRLPFGEEHMPLRLGLRGLKERHEHFALFHDPLVERELDGVLHQFDRLFPGLEAAEFSRVRFADGLEDLWMAAGRLKLVKAVAHLLERGSLGDETPREGERGIPATFLPRRARRRRPIPWPRARRTASRRE